MDLQIQTTYKCYFHNYKGEHHMQLDISIMIKLNYLPIS
jgi:hypothetical protein